MTALALASAVFTAAAPTLAHAQASAPAAVAGPPTTASGVPIPQRVQRTRAVTMTRFVRVFTDLEYDLIDALRAEDKPALDKLLAADFEQRESTRPAEPVARDEWIKSSETKLPGIAQMSAMAVHDRGEHAIASFRLRLAERELFVVDVWRRKTADSYELVTRYVTSSPAPKLLPPAPDGKG